MNKPNVIRLNICYGCMKRIPSGRSVCPECGHNSSARQNSDEVLPEGTVLKGKYLVGKSFDRSVEMVRYLGYDLLTETIVEIGEYFPINDAIRACSTYDLVWKDQDEILPCEKCKDFLEKNESAIKTYSSEDNILGAFYEHNTIYIITRHFKYAIPPIRLRGQNLEEEVLKRIFAEMTRRLLLLLKEDENAVFSPFSVVTLFSILASSTAGLTKLEISDVLHIGEIEPLFLEKTLLMKDGNGFSYANAVCAQVESANDINSDYRQMLKHRYKGELFSSNNMVNSINRWVAKSTNGMIPEIADESMQNMRLCLMNAVAFEAQWAELYKKAIFVEKNFKTPIILLQMLICCTARNMYILKMTFSQAL